MLPSLADLPPEVMAPIFSQLHTEHYSSFLALRFTCRKYRSLSETQLFRDITLVDGPRYSCAPEVEYSLMYRMQHTGDRVGSKVYRICFKADHDIFNLDLSCGFPEMLKRCWDHLTALREVV
jgi:hypothetical protein